MDNPVTSAINKMGENFLVAALTPSMAFVLSTYVAFAPLFRGSEKIKILYSPTFIEGSLIFLLLSTILGFTIYTIEIYVYRAFEGYVFILGGKNRLRNFFLKRHLLRFRKATAKKELIKKQLARTEKNIERLMSDFKPGKTNNKRFKRLLSQQISLKTMKYDLTADLDHNYPTSESYIMPTRFGNRLRAAELYSERYGIDAVALWGKMSACMPNGMMEKVNEANNQCQFLLNGTILGVIFSIMCLLAASIKGIEWWLHTANNTEGGESAIFYVTLAIVSLLIARFFYEASLFNVEKLGEMIRTTYDLHRFNLLEAMHLKLPLSLAEEKKKWREISHFATGNFDYKEDDFLTEDTINFHYIHPPKNPLKN